MSFSGAHTYALLKKTHRNWALEDPDTFTICYLLGSYFCFMSCMKITRLFTWKTPHPSTHRQSQETSCPTPTHFDPSYVYYAKAPNTENYNFLSVTSKRLALMKSSMTKNFTYFGILSLTSPPHQSISNPLSAVISTKKYKNITIPMTPFQHFSSPSTKAWHLSSLMHSSIISNAPLQGKMTQHTISKATTPPLK